MWLDGLPLPGEQIVSVGIFRLPQIAILQNKVNNLEDRIKGHFTKVPIL